MHALHCQTMLLISRSIPALLDSRTYSIREYEIGWRAEKKHRDVVVTYHIIYDTKKKKYTTTIYTQVSK